MDLHAESASGAVVRLDATTVQQRCALRDGQTDATGAASFSYDGLFFGSDTIIAAVGARQVEAIANWIGGDPSVVHTFAGPDGPLAPLAATLAEDDLTVDFSVTVPAGGRALLLHFAAQSNDRGTALVRAGELEALGIGALDGLSAEELAAIVNF